MSLYLSYLKCTSGTKLSEASLGQRCKCLADMLFVTNSRRLVKGYSHKSLMWCNWNDTYRTIGYPRFIHKMLHAETLAKSYWTGLQIRVPLCEKIPTSTREVSPRPISHNKEVDSSLGMMGGESAGVRCIHTLTTPIYNMHWNNMALYLHGGDLPFLSVRASPGILHSSRAGAAPGVPLARSAAWRVQPPWVSLAGHRSRTKGRWVIRGVTRLPRWDSAVAIIQQLVGVSCSVWGVMQTDGCAD